MSKAFWATRSEILRHGIAAHGFLLGLIFVLAVFWSLWFLKGKVTLYEISQKAEVEIQGGAIPLQAEIAGRLTEYLLEPGKPCAALQKIAQLDSSQQELALKELQAELKDTEISLQLAQKQLAQKAPTRISPAEYLRAEMAIQKHGIKLDLLKSKIETQSKDLQQALLTCPEAGQIADRDPSLHPGSWIEARQRLGTLFPDRGLHGVAYFNPGTSLGRLREGQELTFRLDAFPWTQYGALKGKIAQVDRLKKEGLIRAEFDFGIPPGFRGKVEPGLTGSVEVAIEEITPALLVFRSGGVVRP